MSADARRGAGERTRSAQGEKTQSDKLARESVQAKRKAEGEKTAATESEADKRAKSEKKSLAEIDAAEKKRTREHEREERRRTNASEREERRRTANAKREYEARRREWDRNRERSREQTGNAIVGGLSRVASGIGSTASTMHDQIQSARRTRAVSNRITGNAFRTAGVSDQSEIARYQAQVRTFAHDRGIAYEDVAQALQTGQGRGSVLETRDGVTRQQALDEALSTIRIANAEDIDPGQLLAARGRLRASGLSGGSLDEAIRYTIGAAQRGAVEVDQIIQQGLPGATRLMDQRALALGPNATAAQREEARLGAFRESVALQEVGATAGRTAGNTANTLATLNNFLGTPRRQEAILNNINTYTDALNPRSAEGASRAAGLRAFRDQYFERDDTRTGNAMRLREGVNPTEFAVALTQAMGGNSQAAANILAGSGHGNPQSLLANQRDLVSFLANRHGALQTMIAGGGIAQEKINADQAMVEGDDLSQLTRNEEARLAALTDNTKSIVNLSNNFANWTTAHPFGVEGTKGAVGAVTDVLGTKGTAALALTAGAALPTVANAYATITGRTVDGREVSTFDRAQRAGALGGAAFSAVAGGPLGLIGAALTGGGRGAIDLARLIGREVADAVRANPPAVQVPPHAAAVATANAPRPIPGRR